MPRNPAWTEEEIILATEVYVRNERRVLGPGHEAVEALSILLRTLAIHPEDARDEKFRNPKSVGLKMANIRAADPDAEGGLSNGSRHDDYFWRVLGGDEATLSLAAAEIRAKHL